MNLQKEIKLRSDLEAEKKTNLELIAKLKTENQKGLEWCVTKYPSILHTY